MPDSTTKRIELSQGLYALVDAADYDRVAQYRWWVYRLPTRCYAARHVRVAKGVYRKQLLHRFLMDAQPGQEVDHRDGDGLNCTRANLRIATPEQNQQNRGKHRDNTSGYKGVDWMPNRRKWRARIQFNGHTLHLGVFETAIEAARAYDDAARKYHGAFARLNLTPE